jgi:shikimate kinase/3-dehydroquinate synthase
MLRPLLINGFMATGKSTVAREVARRSGRPWVDLDEEVERRAGKSIPELFQQDGEAHFRRIESRALHDVLARQDAPVVSLGGGALLARGERLRAVEHAVVVTLRARISTLEQRLQGGRGRPLAAGGDVATLERTYELRELAYAEAHEVVDVDDQSVDALAARLLEVWERDPLMVAAGRESYSVEVGRNHLESRLAAAVRGFTLALLITDENVDALYGADARRALGAANRAADCVLPPGEEHKNAKALEAIWTRALEVGADRKSCFVGLGGGVMTDVAGFAAATWMRGVPWISASTNLQGMVDASVGGKTAVDLPGAKNCVGAFWQPLRVLCDVSHLTSEPERSYRGALSEVIKTALIGDAGLLDLIEREAAGVLSRDQDLLAQVVRRCIAVKASVVSRDEREGGLRAALNLGHTLGHALEAHGGYGHLTHGEAVSLGLVAALGIGERLGVGSPALSERVLGLLGRFGLPVNLHEYPLAEATALVANDKKKSGASIRFVLCPEPGRIEFRSLALAELESLARSLVAA